MGDPALRLFARQIRVRQGLWFSKASDVLSQTDEIIDIAGGDEGVHQSVLGFCPYLAALTMRAVAMSFNGRPREGIELSEHLCELSQRPGLTGDRSEPFNNSVWVCWILGDGERALKLASEGVRQAERYGSESTNVRSHTGLGTAQVIAGRWTEALRSFDRAHQIIEASEVGIEWGLVALLWHGIAHAHMGDGERALAVAQQAMDGVRDISILSPIAGIQRARILRMVRGAEAVEELATQIDETLGHIKASEYGGMLPLILIERAGLARLRGDDAAAAADLAEARRLHSEMGITGWDDYARSI